MYLGTKIQAPGSKPYPSFVAGIRPLGRFNERLGLRMAASNPRVWPCGDGMAIIMQVDKHH